METVSKKQKNGETVDERSIEKMMGFDLTSDFKKKQLGSKELYFLNKNLVRAIVQY